MTLFERMRVGPSSLTEKKLSWCWQTRATHLEVSQDHQTWYHSIDWVWFPTGVL